MYLLQPSKDVSLSHLAYLRKKKKKKIGDDKFISQTWEEHLAK